MTALGRCLVTGGAGVLGSHLSRALLEQGHAVRVLDLAPGTLEHPALEVRIGDVRDAEAVTAACAGIDTVFHTAACMILKRFPHPEEIHAAWSVNVDAVAGIVKAARAAGVKRLVHTSSNNVTFDREIVDGDESWPYARDARDLYTRTKIEGERIVLAAGGQGTLATCALRPGGIYGPGDRLLLPSLYAAAEKGLLRVALGGPTTLSDNVYIDNLVDAQIAAAEHLEPGSIPDGQAYFISDGNPVNYWAFFSPLLEGVGLPAPRFHLPAGVALGAAFAAEFANRWLGTPEPFITHLEARKLVTTHTNRIEKAKRDFGWQPRMGVDEARARTVEYGRELLAQMRRSGA